MIRARCSKSIDAPIVVWPVASVDFENPSCRSCGQNLGEVRANMAVEIVSSELLIKWSKEVNSS